MSIKKLSDFFKSDDFTMTIDNKKSNHSILKFFGIYIIPMLTDDIRRSPRLNIKPNSILRSKVNYGSFIGTVLTFSAIYAHRQYQLYENDKTDEQNRTERLKHFQGTK
jgi:hypothetical protein